MQWVERGFVLALRPYGENAAVIEIFTRAHGRHMGLVHGAQSPKWRAVLQPGNEVEARWRGRLSEHLGTYLCELLSAHAARLLDDRLRLLALSAAMTLLSLSLPEREPFADLFTETEALLSALEEAEAWPQHYLFWELRLLAALGFGLDPRGKALPRVEGPEGQENIGAGLALTGGLLLREIFAPQGRALPPQRARLAFLFAAGGQEAKGRDEARAR